MSRIYAHARSKLRAISAAGASASLRYAYATAKSSIQGRRATLTKPDLLHSSKRFHTRHSRPKGSVAVSPAVIDVPLDRIGIVVQGPLEHRSEFTLNAVRSYRAQYPGAQVFVSTWDTENPLHLRSFERAGAHVITSEIPANGGIYNHNLQMTSTAAGVLAVREAGLEYCLRSRSDQRLYGSGAVPAMWAALQAFPLTRGGLEARGRIVTTSLDTFRYRLYGISDQLHFGYTSDIAQFWDGFQDDRGPDWTHPTPKTLREQALLRLTEVHFCTRYLEQMGWRLAWTLEDSWSAFRDCFIVLDASSLDLFWPKYSSLEYRWRRYSAISPLEEFTFADWLQLNVSNVASLAAASEWLLDEPWWDVPLD